MNEKNIISSISRGLPVKTLTPYADLASSHGLSEKEIIEGIKELLEQKKIKRFGPVVSNRRIGINQNAMVTLNVPEESLEETGNKIAGYSFVTLCYQRKPIPGVWDYNLYFMVHGSDKQEVKDQIQQLLGDLKIPASSFQILFSKKCYKQKGASY